MSRGFKREAIFKDEGDYLYYLDCFDRFKDQGYKIIEYCLMPNHTHMLIQTGEEVRLQKILKSINTRYAVYKSKKRDFPGPVFQGRPKSILITGSEYLTTVARYILRNPVKAGLVNEINKYKWSSYKLLAKLKTPDWYDDSIVLGMFSSNQANAIKLYKDFIRKPLREDDKEYPLELFNRIAVGNKMIFEKILRKLKKDKRKIGSREINGEKIISTILEENRLKIETIQDSNSKKVVEARRRIVYVMKEICHKESSEIMKYLKIRKSALSNYVNEIYRKIQKKDLKLEEIHRI